MIGAKKRYPLIRYFSIVFLILVLFISVFFLYLKDNKVAALKNSIASLLRVKEDYSKIDSCINILYQAENNSRLYAVTADKSYISQFTVAFQQVSKFLTELNMGSDYEHQITDFNGFAHQKKIRTESYLKLRKLTDSLMIGFSKLGLSKDTVVDKMDLGAISKQFKTVTSYDTIRHSTTVIAPKKKFLGRLAQVFSSKTAPKDSSVTVIKSQRNNDVSNEIKRFNDKLLAKVDNYYRKLYASSNKLKNDERTTLLQNNRLIVRIVAVLQEYKKDEIAYTAKTRAVLGSQLSLEMKALDDLELLNILLLLSMAIVILFNIFQSYRKDKLLISLHKKSSLESHSKSRFLANMSHEIRTPLNSVVGFSEQLGKSNLTPEQSEQVNAIRNSSEMLLELVNEILDFSKYEVGKINLESLPFKPFDEIIEVFNSMNVLAENKNILLEKKITLDKDLCLMGDRLRLKQVVMNLLTNAIKFTMQGKVCLTAQFIANTKRQGILKVQVEDTGIGMARENLEVIFDEFSQVYSAAKTQQQGTGLGLAICKKIVELQGGKISVSSVQDKGSAFTIEVPYEVVEETRAESTTSQAPASGKLVGKRVLLVDDNKMNILLAQTILKKWNMEYDSAFDGREALELFRKKEYDIILTDIQMPVMGGVELTHEIRYNGNFAKSGIPILGITAHVLQENRDAYLKAGMNDLVLKPFLEQELIDQITKYV